MKESEFYPLWSTDFGPDISVAFRQTKMFSEHVMLARHEVCRHIKAPPPKTMICTYFNSHDVLSPIPWYDCLIRQDLLELLQLDRPERLQVGQLSLADGSVFPDHVTLWTDHKVLVRGVRGQMAGPCPHCGISWYQRRSNEMNVIRSSVDDVTVRVATEGFFILNNVVAQQISKLRKSRGWQNLTVQPIDVVEHASDGLPDDLQESYDYLLGP